MVRELAMLASRIKRLPQHTACTLRASSTERYLGGSQIAVRSHFLRHHSSRVFMRHIKPVFNSIACAADRSYSYVVVATKAIPELTKTPKLLAPLLTSPYADEHPQPTYVLMQNGLNVEADLYHAIKKLQQSPSIISTALWIATNLKEGNLVDHDDWVRPFLHLLFLTQGLGPQNRLSIGVYRHNDYTTTTNSPNEADTLSDFGRMVGLGGATLSIVPEIQRIKFGKNFWNVAFSSLATLTRHRLPAIFRDPPSDSSVKYAPYISPTTRELIKNHTIPFVRATLEELLTLGIILAYTYTIVVYKLFSSQAAL
jgi:2-dehydropantoate 2-reductase